MALELGLGGGRLTSKGSCRSQRLAFSSSLEVLCEEEASSLLPAGQRNRKTFVLPKQNIKAVIFHFNTHIWDFSAERGDGHKPTGHLTSSESLHLSLVLQPYTIFSPLGSQHGADSAEQARE